MKSKKTIVIFVVIILGFLIFRSCSLKKKNGSEDRSYRIVTPFMGDIEHTISVSGVVESQNRLEVIPPISGRIEKILFEEGADVKKGDILAWMSSTERATLLDTARIRGDEAMKNWEDVYKPTALISPINGKIIKRMVEPGQTVSTTTPVLIVSDRLIIKAWADETDIGSIKIGQESSIVLDAYPDRPIIGKVFHISYDANTVNNVTLYDVTILPESIPKYFRSGMSADINIIVESKKNVMLVPIDAVNTSSDQSYVLIKQDKKKEPVEKKIKVGIEGQENVEIISGLSLEDDVAIEEYISGKEENKKKKFSLFGRKR